MSFALAHNVAWQQHQVKPALGKCLARSCGPEGAVKELAGASTDMMHSWDWKAKVVEATSWMRVILRVRGKGGADRLLELHMQ